MAKKVPITSSDKEYVEHTRKYLKHYVLNAISLNDTLIEAGAIVVENKEECDIDLSPEQLDKAKIIKLIS